MIEMPIADAEKIAAGLLADHKQNRKFEALPRTRLPDLAASYDVQDAFVARLCEDERGQIVGYKIGLTSPTMQRMCGIDTPIGGAILSGRVHRGDTIRRDSFGRLGLEFEIGVRLGRDLLPRHRPFDFNTVAAAVDGVCAAVELVDDRHADYRGLDVHSLVADNSWNGGAMLGSFSASWPDLRDVEGIVTCDGHEIGRGFGRDIMGHPFEPLVWLVNHVTARGGVMRSGMIVLTGSLIQTQFPEQGRKYIYVLGTFGPITVNVI
jgi:2-oxo-3-hexenedioate decarboxylase/2-keto-4-pentenoate hydratase